MLYLFRTVHAEAFQFPELFILIFDFICNVKPIPTVDQQSPHS